MDGLKPDQARAVLDLHLPSIEAERHLTRSLLQAVPADKLAFRPADDGRTVSELVWHLVLAEHWFLSAVCEAHCPPVPADSPQGDVAAALAWDAEHFPRDFERLTQLTGADLLRPMDLGGESRPAIAMLPLGRANIALYQGQLLSCLQMCLPKASTESVEAAAGISSNPPSGDLSEAELAAVAGGGDLPNVAVIPVTDGPTEAQMGYGGDPGFGSFAALFGAGASGGAIGGAAGAGLGLGLGLSAGVQAVSYLYTLYLVGLFL